MVFVLGVSSLARKLLRQMEAIKQWNRARDPERAIEQAPGERNMADVSANQGERNDGRAGNQPAAKHPGITDGIPKWPNEKQRNDEMPESEPVSPITDKRKSGVGRFETEEHEGDPSPKSRNELISGGIVDAEPAAKKRKFLEQRKRRQTAQDKSRDKEAQTYTVCEKRAFQPGKAPRPGKFPFASPTSSANRCIKSAPPGQSQTRRGSGPRERRSLQTPFRRPIAQSGYTARRR